MEEILDRLAELWSLVEGVWQASAFGIDLGRLLVALLVFAIFWLFRGLFARLTLGAFQRLADRTKTRLDDKILGALSGPVGLVPVIIGAFFALQLLALQEPFDWIALGLIRSLIAFTIFWGFYRLVGPVAQILPSLGFRASETLLGWLSRVVRAVFVFIGGATILELWGIEVGPLLAGLGLLGVAVALGAQDLFKNLIAGMLIIAERRFQIGDWIKVDDVVEGTVERVNFRSTTIRRFDKAPVHVPNTVFADQAVTNFSAMTHRRIFWLIGVEYRTTVDQLRTIRDEIEAYVLGNEDFADPDEVATFVRIDSFGASSIDIMLYCFTRTTKWGEWLEIKEALALKIKEIVEGAGTGFAFPSQSVYLEHWPEGTPELFAPPASPDTDGEKQTEH